MPRPLTLERSGHFLRGAERAVDHDPPAGATVAVIGRELGTVCPAVAWLGRAGTECGPAKLSHLIKCMKTWPTLRTRMGRVESDMEQSPSTPAGWGNDARLPMSLPSKEGARMKVRDVLEIIFAEATGQSREYVREAMAAMPEEFRRGLEREHTDEEAERWLGKLRTELPGIRRWIEDGARSMDAKLAAAGLGDPRECGG